MPNDVRTRFECSTPILSVADMAARLRYYEGVLGFTNAEWGDEDFTCVTRDGASIYLCAKHQGRGGTWVRIGVEAVDRNFHFGFQTENSIHPFRPPAIPQSCLDCDSDTVEASITLRQGVCVKITKIRRHRGDDVG
jgi:hypothetical protein